MSEGVRQGVYRGSCTACVGRFGGEWEGESGRERRSRIEIIGKVRYGMLRFG